MQQMGRAHESICQDRWRRLMAARLISHRIVAVHVHTPLMHNAPPLQPVVADCSAGPTTRGSER